MSYLKYSAIGSMKVGFSDNLSNVAFGSMKEVIIILMSPLSEIRVSFAFLRFRYSILSGIVKIDILQGLLKRVNLLLKT